MREADAPVLADLATRLNVEAYALSALGPSQRGLGPALGGWLAELRRRVTMAAVENLRRDAEVSGALDRLAEAGIDLIFLKGSALRLVELGRAGRFQCDVDVLLRREDLERAEALLTGLGFCLDESYLEREELLRRHFHLGFERRGAVVELHWDVDSTSPKGFVERLWDASGAIEAEGRSRRVLSPPHQLLFGCLHLSRHAFRGGLRWLADLRPQLALDAGEAARFAAEAEGWPARAVRCPLWLLADLGVREAAVLAQDGGADPVERTLLRRLLIPLLLEEPWMGIPAWRLEQALRTWLFSERSLPGLLAEASSRGMSGRLRAWAAGAEART